jgi:hypothetical protein
MMCRWGGVRLFCTRGLEFEFELKEALKGDANRCHFIESGPRVRALQ